jgi:4-amino-4-deoxy-L-arabinose transferase-like glycosyltransferase
VQAQQQPARTTLETALLVAALAIFLATSLIVAVVLPRGRGNDEDGHATYVRHVADYGKLPDPLAVDFGANREGHQPPLYYLGGAAWLQGARSLGLSQDVVRLYSTVIGLGWFALVWLVARRLLPVGVRVLPNLAMASLPMAAQLAGTVNNDVLEITLATLMFYAAVRVWQGSPRWYVIAALAGSGSVMSKLFGVGAAVVLGVALTYRAVKTTQLPRWLLGLALAAVPVAAFVTYNLMTTGLLLPEIHLDDVPAVANFHDPWDAGTLRPFLDVTWQTFVGRLGSWDIVLPGWFYYVQAGWWLLALIGLVWVRRLGLQPTTRTFLWLGLGTLVASILPYVYLNLLFFQPQARYFFAGLAGLLLIAAIGWGALAQRTLGRRLRQPWVVPAGVLLVLDVAAVVVTAAAL